MLIIGIFKLQEDFKNDVEDVFYDEIVNRQLNMNVEYKVGGLEYVSLVNSETKEDVVQKLVSSGFLLAERRREKRLVKFVFDYVKVQEKVKIVRVSVWWECLFGIYQFILVVSDLEMIVELQYRLLYRILWISWFYYFEG